MLHTFGAHDVEAASDRISAYTRKTPIERSIYLGNSKRKVYFKLESQQLGKSFKIRGVFNTLLQLSDAELSRGVATISTGNHAVALAMATNILGIEECIAIVPVGTPSAKLDRIRFYGARSMALGNDYDDAVMLGLNYIDRTEMFYVDPYMKEPRVYAGQGTIGLEILEQKPEVDTIVVPIGGGGLITGIAVAVKAANPNIRIVGVQTEACPAMVASLKLHECFTRYPVEGNTVCEAIVGGIGELSYKMLPDLVDDIIVVSEKSIRQAFRFMIEKEQVVVEAGSAMVVAAMQEYGERIGGSNVVLVISGGNIDAQILDEVISEQA